MTRVRPPSLTVPLTVSLLTAAIVATANAQAVVDSVPKMVSGRAPSVSVTIANTSRPTKAPTTGDVLKANSTATDPDGDAITGISYRWLRGDVEVGTEDTYTTTTDDTDQELRVEVRANTDAASTTPATGMATAAVTIANAAPVASNLRIDGTRAVGQTLTARFDYTDAEGDAAGEHLYSWCRRGHTCGISTAPTYTLQDADYTREITFEVIPVARTGTLEGETAYSPFGLALIPGRAPVITNQRYTGEARQGGTMTVQYTFSDADGDLESGTIIDWCWEDATVKECGQGSGPTFVLLDEHLNRNQNLIAEITPKTATGNPNTGATVIARYEAPASAPKILTKAMYQFGSVEFLNEVGSVKRMTTGEFLHVGQNQQISADSKIRIRIPCALAGSYFTVNAYVDIDTPWGDWERIWFGQCGDGDVEVAVPSSWHGRGIIGGFWNFNAYTYRDNYAGANWFAHSTAATVELHY